MLSAVAEESFFDLQLSRAQLSNLNAQLCSKYYEMSPPKHNIRAMKAAASQQLLQVSTGYASYQKRNLNVHEYIGIDIMRENGIAVPKGKVASSPEEAGAIRSLVFLVVILYVMKAQVLAGGRGKGTFKDGFQGGVHMCTTRTKSRTLHLKCLATTW